MATRPKAVIESRNGEKFSPITIAKNVLTDDGQNLHDILSDRKEDMMTSTIENSSSMSKVGQGDNVDFSDNVMNGAYEDVVLKGKSLVNVIQEPSSQDIVLPYSFEEGERVTINDTHVNGRVEVEVKGRTLVNLAKVRSVDAYNKCLDRNIPIKPNTKYIGIFKATYYQETGGNYACFMTSTVSVGDDPNYNGDHIYSISCPDGLGTEHKLNKGDQQFTFTSKSNEQYLHIRTGGGKGFTYEDMIVLEYQEGMENWDIPYFEGMASVQAPTVKTCGKNLFYGEVINNKDIHSNTGLVVGGNRTIPVNFIPVKPKTTYALTRPISSGNVGIRYYSKNQNYLSTKSFVPANGITTFTFTTPIGCYFLKFVDESNKLDNNYQIEEGLTATTYERYQSSSLTLPEEIVLRGLPNGVCDTYNTRTGVYTQRIGELTLNGKESWVISSASSSREDTAIFDLNVPNAKIIGNSVVSTISDKFKTIPNKTWREELGEWVNKTPNNHIIAFSIFRSKLSSVDVNGFKAWLQLNPTKVQYELATPIIAKINLPSTLKSWNTTTHIYSEIPENSLYPILSHSNPSYPVILKPSTKYSIVANSYSNGHTNSAINFNLGGATASTTVGSRVTTITTPSALSNELLTMSGRGNKLNNVMVIEGDVVGDEPYFEGICDCKSPILMNIGKNLLPDSVVWTPNRSMNDAGNTSSSDKPYSHTTEDYLPIEWIKVSSSQCRISYETDNLGWTNVVQYDDKKAKITKTGSNNSTGFKFTVQPNAKYFRLSVSTYKLDTVMIEEGLTATSYESYKSNTTTFTSNDDEIIVLRSLPNGICDTLNVKTGEYVQNIGEIVLDGSQDEIYSKEVLSNGIVRFNFSGNTNNIANRSKPFGTLICDKLTTSNRDIDNLDYVRIHSSNGGFWIYQANKNIDENELKNILNVTPLEIQYELAEPITKTVDISGYPYAYENGHILLESGSQEQSLTPTIEYSIVANRNGQIRSNQKMVERHQKQLDHLQAMVLTNLVNTQYEQTLTNLKYDLKNVREEVK